MTLIDYIQSTERQVGEGHPTLSDTLNRALRTVLTASGLDPDADFGGFGPMAANGVFNVLSPIYGAVGDGTTDDTTAIQAAATAAVAAGGILLFPKTSSYYKVSNVINITGACTIQGPGEVRTTSTTAEVFKVTGSNVTFTGHLRIIGPSTHTSSQSTGKGIYVLGTSAASPATGITIEDCYVSGFNLYGILLEWVDGFLVRGSTVTEIANAGISMLSCLNGRVLGSKVDQIGNTTSTYGIACSRRETDSLTTEPRTTNVVVAENRISNVVFWEALDTHGGERISFIGNIITNCHIGVNVGGVDNGSNVPTWAPIDCVVAYNQMDSGVSDGTTGSGISFTGISLAVAATGAITGNVIRRYGLDAAAVGGGAITVYYSAGVPVCHNVIVEASLASIAFYHDNTGFLCSSNVAIDVWSELFAAPNMVEVASTNNTGTIVNNTLIAGTKSATHLNVGGSRVDNTTGNVVTYGPNIFTAATTPYTNAGTSQLLGPGSIKRTSVGDADVTLQVGVNSEIQVYSTVLTANRAVTLSTTGAYDGARFRVVRSALGAFTLAIGAVYTIPASTAAVVDVVFQAGAWVLERVSLLATPAPLASPAFTGTPSLPTGTTGVTQSAADNSTKLATTAYVDRATTRTAVTSAAPTGTPSATAVMMGLAGSITPTRGTRILIFATGQLSNDTLNDGATVDLRYGTGSSPTNGAAVTGTLAGIAQTMTAKVAADRSGFSLLGYVTGLTVGTAYWLDLSLLAVTGGTASVTGVSLVAVEEH